MSNPITSIPNASQWEIAVPWERNNWNDQLPAAEDELFFHTSNWASVLRETYQFAPIYFVEPSPHGTVKGVFPVMEVQSFLTGRRGVALPFSDYCPPVSSDGASTDHAIETVLAYGRKAGWSYFEWRGGSSSRQPSEKYYRHILTLTDSKQMFSRLHDTTRRNIKKAQRENIRVEFQHSLEAIHEFYRLNCMTRREHGLPPQPFSFFRKIHEHVLTQGMGFVALAYLKERVVAGAVYFHFRKEALYKYGASDRNYQQLRANNLLMWEAIQWFARNGFRTLCFGRTDMHHEGLRHFKQGWGTQEKIIEYHRYDFKKEAFVEARSKISGLHTRVFNKLPGPLLKMAGVLLYKHMG
jgi:CelD/BcsL family acetyltransferase involved in cellulose biosynthesis